MNRHECIALIDQAGKREEFIKGWGRTPEQYFAEYSDREPSSGQKVTAEGYNIWEAVLNDLEIPFPRRGL